MADQKISQLTGATTPLAGTEVLPIVQGGATVKVAVSNLTAGRATTMLSADVLATNGQAHLVGGSTAGGVKLQAWNAAGNADGYLAFEGYTIEYGRYNTSGDWFLGTTTVPDATNKGIRLTRDITLRTPKFSVGNTSALTYMIEWINSNGIVGSISTSGTATAYNTASDYRLKNIDGPITNSGDFIDALNPVQGTWKADNSKFVGLLAHEVQAISPSSVAGEKDDPNRMQSMSYASSEIISNMIAELKSLRARVKQLENP